MKHSDIVGGSTAARVIACPASVKLCQQMPPAPTSEYANEGSMLHEAIAAVIGENLEPEALKGFTAHGVTLTDELYEAKLWPYIDAFDEYVIGLEAEQNDTASILVEQEVSFGDFLPDVFGSCDVLMRVGSRVVVLDWKFGSGVQVDPEENAQLMFYAAAAMRTAPKLFEDATEIDLVIVQGGEARVWETTFPRIAKFESDLKRAVKQALGKNPKYKEGKHCRWCAGKPLCPLMQGAVDRALKADLQKIDPSKLGLAVEQSYLLEQWIKDLRQLAETSLENGIAVPGLKLVAKRGRREWAKEESAILGAINDAAKAIELQPEELFKHELLSPAQMEKVLKKHGLQIPEGLVANVSSGHTMALESDPRPALGGIIDLATKLKRLQ